MSGYNAAYQPGTTKVTLPGGLTGYAGEYTTTSTYTTTGQIKTHSTPAVGGLPAEKTNHGYDSYENPSSVIASTGDIIAGATQYGHLNQIAGFQQYDPNYASPTADTTGTNNIYFSWDATTGRLANQSATNTAKGVLSDLGTTNYTYMPSGKLSAREHWYPSRPGQPDDYQCYGYDYASRLAAVWTAQAKNCNTAPTSDSTSVTGLGGPAPYAQTYAYTPAGDRSQVKRFDATGNLKTTENYTYPGTTTTPGAFSAQTPFRQLDTRNGTGGINGPVGPGQTISVKVTGRGGIPATGVSAVAMNITVTEGTTGGLITAYAGGTQQPGTSNLNYGPAQTLANFAITPVAADGTISFTNNSGGTVQLIADTSGYYLAGTPTTPGAFSAQTPFRQLDSRNGTGGVNGPVGPGQTISVKVTGPGGIPATGVSAVAMNITVTAPTSVGVITAYAGGTQQPGTSNVNYVSGQTVANFAVTPVAADGTISFTNNSGGTVQLIADTSGYFNSPATGQPGPHRLQSLTSTPATGTPTTHAFTWDSSGRMTGRAGETLIYTPDGKLATTKDTSTLPANPNPSAGGGTPPAPAAGTAGSEGTRYYDAGGNLVGITDGTGTTVTIGSITAHSTPGGVKAATKAYSFAGKIVAQRTAAGGTVKLAFILSDRVNTAQTIVQPTSGTTAITVQTRYTDPLGLARGATQAATGSGAFATAAGGTTGVGSNAANPAGYAAANGYIAGLADTVSALTHLGTRDLDPVTGIFTAPDPILPRADQRGFTPYTYAYGNVINTSDPTGLRPTCDCQDDGVWTPPIPGSAGLLESIHKGQDNERHVASGSPYNDPAYAIAESMGNPYYEQTVYQRHQSNRCEITGIPRSVGR